MKYILFFKGPATPPKASHKGWPTWFTKLGAALVDHGSPIAKGMSCIAMGHQPTPQFAALARTTSKMSPKKYMPCLGE